MCSPERVLSVVLHAGKGVTQVWGTQPDAIDEAEDRDRWMAVLDRLDIKQPPGTMVTTEKDALKASSSLGYPVRAPLRPSPTLLGILLFPYKSRCLPLLGICFRSVDCFRGGVVPVRNLSILWLFSLVNRS